MNMPKRKSILSLLMVLVSIIGLPSCKQAPKPAAVEQPVVLPADNLTLDSFENPGGMWMPQQLAQHAAILKALGVEVADTLADPLDHPLGAIVNFGGCSASFVSPDGLIITNHHCAISSLQFNSTPEHNLLEDGFLAAARAEEKQMEIGGRIWVSQDFIDVTDTVRAGLERIKNDQKRSEEIENRIKQIIKDNEDMSVGLRCMVRSYFEGDLFVLIKQLEIKDVRLVYAPNKGIGYFGGDEDNWKWPRHCGDYSFFRAYVAPDGKPADFAPENVPYKPKQYLKLASIPLKKGDFVMVAGYPGRTSRLKTADEARFAVETANPLRIYLYQKTLDILKELAGRSEELKIKVSRRQFGLTNSMQYTSYLQDSLEANHFLARKEIEQEALTAWIKAGKSRRKQWGGVLEEIAKVNAQYLEHYQRDTLLGSMIGAVDMLGNAQTIVRMAEERPKADDQRKAGFQERDWERMFQRQHREQNNYDRQVDQALLRMYLLEIEKLPAREKAALLQPMFKVNGISLDRINAVVQEFYAEEVKIENAGYRVELLKSATTEELKQNPDPFIQMALRLRPLTKELEDNGDHYSGKMALLRPKYLQGLRAFKGGLLAPDANGTLRVTYGRIGGYQPEPNAPVYEPFTLVSQIVQKNTGKEPFNSPQPLLDAIAAGQFGPYANAGYDELTVDFLSDVDTTGGNSGSATMNNKGELVGLLFDGTTESLISDWMFLPGMKSSIQVDIRYVLWIMDYVDKAHNLLKEMGIEPAGLSQPAAAVPAAEPADAPAAVQQ